MFHAFGSKAVPFESFCTLISGPNYCTAYCEAPRGSGDIKPSPSICQHMTSSHRREATQHGRARLREAIGAFFLLCHPSLCCLGTLPERVPAAGLLESVCDCTAADRRAPPDSEQQASAAASAGCCCLCSTCTQHRGLMLCLCP